MIEGLDLLAGARYRKQVIHAAKKGYAIGLFAETFGNAYKTAEAAIKAGCKLLRMQLIWSDAHQFGDKDIPKIKKLAAKYNALANKYAHVDVRLSPFCEHNVNNPDKYLDICQASAPSCLIINTPWKGAFSKKYINEIHGDHKIPGGRYQYSFDGEECVNSDVSSYLNKHKNAEVFFMWSNRFNLRYSEKDKTPRPQRIRESKERSPSKEYIDSIAYLFGDKQKVEIPKNWLVKSHAERHGPGASDFKADNLLIISPFKAKFIELKRGDKTIAKLRYYGPFEKSHRFYATSFGYKYGANLEVFIEKKSYGIINGGFRAGNFR